MRNLVVLFILFCASVQGLYASSEKGAMRVDVMATGGYATFPDNDWIDHWTAGGATRLFLTKRFAIEAELLYMHGPDTDRDLLLMPSVVYHFGTENQTQPYLIGGGGILRHTETFSTGDFTSTEWTFSAGGGVRHYFNDRWFLQGDARLGWNPFLRTSFGIGYSFGK